MDDQKSGIYRLTTTRQIMLNPDQTTIRRLQNEIHSLKIENSKLKSGILNIRSSVAKFLETLIPYAKISERIELEELIVELKE